MMKSFSLSQLFAFVLFGLLAITLVSESKAQLNPNDEYIILSGGPALRQWENLRREEHQHDRWWGNFIRTARIRIQQLQKASNNTVQITWLVYREGYETRGKEDGAPLIANIESVRNKYKVNLVWYNTRQEVINYINNGKNRRVTKISGFEFFGHSNKYCFLLDYGNKTLGASNCYLHQRHLSQLNRSAFAKNCYAKSWGCHSGESFTDAFRKATGRRMIGAIGKTDYSDIWKQTLPVVSPGGRWVQ